VYLKKSLIVAIILAAAVAISLILLGNANSHKIAKSSAATEQTPAQSTPDETSAEVTTSLPLFRRVGQNYLRGSQPAHGGIDTLKRLGVRTVVDLRSIYDHTDDVGLAAERAGLVYHWFPLSVWNPPTDKEAQDFISVVTDKAKGPFYVFCSDGIHRTGEMTAIYRVMQDGWTVEQALKEMDEFGFSPYYWSLRNYVWAFARKFRPAAVPPAARSLSSRK
jgi:tyrosine-protein phosphatase SIW14